MLSSQEKLYAHHFGRACWAGIPIVAAQTSTESPALLELIALLFRQGTEPLRAAIRTATFTDDHWEQLLDYSCFCVGNLANYRAVGDAKVLPEQLTPAQVALGVKAVAVTDGSHCVGMKPASSADSPDLAAAKAAVGRAVAEWV